MGCHIYYLIESCNRYDDRELWERFGTTHVEPINAGVEAEGLSRRFKSHRFRVVKVVKEVVYEAGKDESNG